MKEFGKGLSCSKEHFQQEDAYGLVLCGVPSALKNSLPGGRTKIKMEAIFAQDTLMLLRHAENSRFCPWPCWPLTPSRAGRGQLVSNPKH